VLLAKRGEQGTRAEMEHGAVPAVRELPDVVIRSRLGEEAHRRQTVPATREFHILTPEEVAAMQRDERQEVRLARRVPEVRKALASLNVGHHRSNFPTLRWSWGVPPRGPDEEPRNI
jgi:hypothetical protein